MRDAARVRVGPMKACSNEGELATCGGALTCEEHGGPADLRQVCGSCLVDARRVSRQSNIHKKRIGHFQHWFFADVDVDVMLLLLLLLRCC